MAGIIVEVPKLIVKYGEITYLPCAILEASILSLIFSANASDPSAAVFGNITMNSSPPYLAIRSIGRFMADCNTADTFFKQVSPAICPCLSLYSLKKSMSISIIDRGVPSLTDLLHSSLSDCTKPRRLVMPEFEADLPHIGERSGFYQHIFAFRSFFKAIFVIFHSFIKSVHLIIDFAHIIQYSAN